MKRYKVDSSDEARILTAMIVSDRFLSEISSVYDPEYVESKYVQIVADWCLEYHKKYTKAPDKHIEDIYREKAEHIEPAQQDLIEQFLSTLNRHYEQNSTLNIEYLMDVAEKKFGIKALENLATEINQHLKNGDKRSAEEAVAKYDGVSFSSSQWIDMNDPENIKKAWNIVQEPLFSLPGAIGELLNSLFIRSGLVSLWAPAKRGKTWMVEEFAVWACRHKLNVAVIETGDMTWEQMMHRHGGRIKGQPIINSSCGTWSVPVFDNGVQFEQTKAQQDPLTWRGAARIIRQFQKRIQPARLLMQAHPMKTINVAGIRQEVSIANRNLNFIPDVIIIDYADILAPENNWQRDKREQINDTWSALRRMSQELHCLVITMSQSDALSYSGAGLMTMNNFSDSRYKNDHVTGVIGLNQTDHEKKESIARFNVVYCRNSHTVPTDFVEVTQDLRSCRPVTSSRWGWYEEKNEESLDNQKKQQ